ncbi:MAG: transposase [Burkholderiaceae bacterium]
MPRRARLRLPGIPIHLIQRGNNRQACYFADEDYQFYLHHLDELARKFECAVHAYVLMTNHVHLLLTPQHEDSASLLMKHLGQRYVQYVNRTYRRSGTLWEGRFRSCIAQSESYVLHCYRYIELNPVRAAMVAHPREYRWSSYACNAEGRFSPLVTPHALYLELGKDEHARRNAYGALFKSELDPETIATIRQATHGNYALGSKAFVAQIEEALGRRAQPGKAGRPVKATTHFDRHDEGLF